jgi:hypothetical protein
MTSPSPEVIAAIINSQLDQLNPRPTRWDKLCFGAQMVALVAITDEPWLKSIAQDLNARIYAMYDTHKDVLLSAYADAKVESVDDNPSV